MIQAQYNIRFKEVLTDNSSEFGQGKEKDNEMTNPFKRMVKEMGLKQQFIRPYRPHQGLNGKIPAEFNKDIMNIDK